MGENRAAGHQTGLVFQLAGLGEFQTARGHHGLPHQLEIVLGGAALAVQRQRHANHASDGLGREGVQVLDLEPQRLALQLGTVGGTLHVRAENIQRDAGSGRKMLDVGVDDVLQAIQIGGLRLPYIHAVRQVP